MGYPREMFDEKIDDELVCPVCWDVLENVVCLPCGHAFCMDCIPEMDGGREEEVKCPLCRLICLRGVDFTPVLPLQSMVRKQQVRCCAPEATTTALTMTTAQIKLNDEKADAAEEHCDWRGTIEAWETHLNKECLFADVPCPIQGCSWVGKRKDVHKHNREAYMVHLLLHQRGKSNGEDSVQKFSPRLLNRKHERDEDFYQVDLMHRRRRQRFTS